MAKIPDDHMDPPKGGDDLSRSVSGGAFVFDQPDLASQTIWGSGNDIFWAEGEALMIAAVQGLGKTTVGGQLLRARIFGGSVLGLPVRKAEGRTLLLAMDRPQQAARSLRRQFTPDQREVLDERLVVWPGPPPKDFAADPSMMARMADHYDDISDVYVDSLKDAALGLSTDEVGAAYNRARQTLLASGRQLEESHHNIKRNPQGGKPSTIADVYGSTWLTSGCGSVILLVGEPGSLVIDLKHVKSVIDEVGPWKVLVDTDSGDLTRLNTEDLSDFIRVAGGEGVGAREFAARIFETKNPTASQVEKARRRLVNWEKTKGLYKRETKEGHRWSYPFGKGFEGQERAS